MDCIELAKQVEKYKIIRAFEDGVTDALIHGVRDFIAFVRKATFLSLSISHSVFSDMIFPFC